MKTTLTLRKPSLADGRAVWELVANSESLDPNSPYCYLLLCKHFAETCTVAECEGKIVGFVTAYRPPATPDVLFVWQIGVEQSVRGRGLGSALLLSLLQGKACQDVSFLEATVTPSNLFSQRLFRSIARRLNTPFTEGICFGEELFPGGNHEAEHIVRIGPFNISEQCSHTEDP